MTERAGSRSRVSAMSVFGSFNGEIRDFTILIGVPAEAGVGELETER